MASIRLRLATVILSALAIAWALAVIREGASMLPLAALLGGGSAICATVLALRLYWARWLTLAFAFGCAVTGAAWVLLLAAVRDPLLLAQAAASPLLLALLVGRAMSTRYETADVPRSPWHGATPSALRTAAVVLNLVAGPTLLVCSRATRVDGSLIVVGAGLLALASAVLTAMRHPERRIVQGLTGLTTLVGAIITIPQLGSECGGPDLWSVFDVTAFVAIAAGLVGMLSTIAAAEDDGGLRRPPHRGAPPMV